jgi:hypothetical protein
MRKGFCDAGGWTGGVGGGLLAVIEGGIEGVVQAVSAADAQTSENARRDRRGGDEFKNFSCDAAGRQRAMNPGAL